MPKRENISQLNSWVEISESNYAHNINFFRKLVGTKVELAAVVKANAYGHGWREIAKLAARHGVDSFCVHSLEEALRLREQGFTQDILVMGHVPLNRLKIAIANRLRLVLYNRETLAEVENIVKESEIPALFHLKIDTGTNRQGIDAGDLYYFLERFRQTTGLVLDGIYTHFANIEDTTNHDFARQQIQKFKEVIAQVNAAGFPAPKIHTACSAAILLFPETYFDMVRLGISQYGLWPSRETLVSYQARHSVAGKAILRPTLTWKCRISQLRTVPAHQTVGYGRTYQTTRESRIAILPVGYSDGYDRRLSNQSYVLVRGRRAPVRGRICMNLMMVDVTDIPDVRLEEEAVLLGKQGAEEISAEQLAAMIGTINYEIVTRINPEIPRIIVP